jgi:hypothetical protein
MCSFHCLRTGSSGLNGSSRMGRSAITIKQKKVHLFMFDRENVIIRTFWPPCRSRFWATNSWLDSTKRRK